MIRIDLTLPDGTAGQPGRGVAAETFSASTETCDVRIGDNVFAGDLHTTPSVPVKEVDITLTGQVPAWRPETGHWLFGEEGEHYFAWLPSVPQGRVEATYRVGGTSRTTRASSWWRATPTTPWELMYFGKARPAPAPGYRPT